MKARKSFIEQNTQLNGVLKQSLIGSCPSSLNDAREMGFIDYKFLDVEMNLPIVRAETYGKLEIRTTFEFYNDIYLAFNSGKYFKMNLFSEKLFNENGIFRLETIGCENTASTDIPIFTFTFSYRLTNYFIQ